MLAVAAASDELQATATAAAAAAAGDGLNASVAPGVRGEAAASGDPGVDPGAALRKGTLFGAVSLIVGNTVGAGMCVGAWRLTARVVVARRCWMRRRSRAHQAPPLFSPPCRLALPAVSAPAGLGPTSAGLVVMWGLLALDALLIAEVNLAARAARDAGGAQQGGGARQAAPAGGSIVTLRQMAEFSLGQAGKGLTLVYLGLAYSLLTAYATKAAEVGARVPGLGVGHRAGRSRAAWAGRAEQGSLGRADAIGGVTLRLQERRAGACCSCHNMHPHPAPVPSPPFGRSSTTWRVGACRRCCPPPRSWAAWAPCCTRAARAPSTQSTRCVA